MRPTWKAQVPQKTAFLIGVSAGIGKADATAQGQGSGHVFNVGPRLFRPIRHSPA
jgi:hypothetical protein